ncbi:hypothetical protein HHI36_010817 [Cryptolaemus montrouzieri]|uniref:Uncharacterized protein n=1 Tax=Cryptolaemus montrouzieri TaxID=559131 RepID=A0ABD2MJZ4_9CUCU
MTTAFYSGDYNNQYNGGYYPVQQQPYTGQNYNVTPNYANNFATQGFNQGLYAQNSYNPTQTYNMNQMNQAYNNNYSNGFGSNFVQPNQLVQQSQMIQQNQSQRPKSAPEKKNPNLPLEIRGGVVISTCHCAKKNGLQDHCGRSVCRVENENKRRRQRIWQDYPTKDTNANSSYNAMSPSGDANNLIINPAYNESFDNQIVPSNAQPVPVSYNYGV